MKKCRWCEAEHGPVCPHVKAIEYHVDGTVKRVEFKTAVDYRPVLAPYLPAPFPIPYVAPVPVWPGGWPVITCGGDQMGIGPLTE